jgi:hypothetical protein
MPHLRRELEDKLESLSSSQEQREEETLQVAHLNHQMRAQTGIDMEMCQGIGADVKKEMMIWKARINHP